MASKIVKSKTLKVGDRLVNKADDDEKSAVGKESADRWWKEGIIYQIYIRSFFDSNQDGIGDLNGKTK